MSGTSGFRWIFIMHKTRRERLLQELPRPDKIWHRVPAHNRADCVKWEFAAWKPSIHALLDPLHGYRGELPGNNYFAVIRPPIVERIRRYRQALGVVHEFSAWEDLIPISVYRRQITNVGGLIEVDMPFFLLVQKALPCLRPTEVLYLAERMPPRSNVRGMLLCLAVRRLKSLVFYGGSATH